MPKTLTNFNETMKNEKSKFSKNMISYIILVIPSNAQVSIYFHRQPYHPLYDQGTWIEIILHAKFKSVRFGC